MDVHAKYVRRYTTLSNVLYSLIKRKLVLLNPSTWDDKNDVQFLEFYRARQNIGSLFALCCTLATETYHHWKVFAPGIEGICIEFDRRRLEARLDLLAPKVRYDTMKYKPISALEGYSSSVIEQLPFLKREGYRDEKEWRIISSDPSLALKTIEIDFSLEDIHLIRLNPWMPESLIENTRTVIKSLPDCANISVQSSSLTNNTRWIAAGQKIADIP